MKNWKDILTEHGIEVPEDKQAEVDKAIVANYKTVSEFTDKTSKLTELQAQVTELQGDKTKLQAIADSIGETDPEKLKAISDGYAKLQADIKARDEAENAKSAAEKFAEAMRAAVGDKKFANDLVKQAVYAKVKEMHESDQAKGLSDLLNEATKDVSGVWANGHVEPNVIPKPQAGTENKTYTREEIKKMSPDEINKNWEDISKSLAGI